MPHLVGHTNQCAISSSQVTLLEFVGTWRSSRRRFGLQSARLALSSSQQHRTSCTTRHAPCTMHRLTVSCTAHGAPCTTGVYHRVLGTVHYALRTLRHTTSLMGPFRRSLHAFHHHASSQSLSPGHRYTVLVCMSGTMPYPDGMIARACGCVFYWLLRSFPFLGQSQSTS